MIKRTDSRMLPFCSTCPVACTVLFPTIKLNFLKLRIKMINLRINHKIMDCRDESVDAVFVKQPLSPEFKF